MRIWLFASLVGPLACAPSVVLPPIQPRPEWERSTATPLPALLPVAPGAGPVSQDFDPATGFTRYFVTTHRGVYTAWVEKPQITFFALIRGQERPTHAPEWIGLVFRTLEPQFVTSSQLLLRCGALTDSIGLAAGSRVALTGNTHSHFLTYLIPVSNVASFAACPQGEMEIGQVRAKFRHSHLGGLRALLLRLGAPSAAVLPN